MKQLLALFSALVIAGGALPSAWASPASPVKELVSRLPAKSVSEGQKILEQLLAAGPTGLQELIGMVLPPGKQDDSKPRFALNGMAFYVTRPGAERRRVLFSRALLTGLQKAHSPHVKSFLLSLVQLVGKDEAVAPLSVYLTDHELCEPAARALVRIGTPAAAHVLLAALPKVTGPNRVTVVHSLGDLRVEDAAAAIVPFAASDNTDLRRTSLWALAEIGNPVAAATLAKAASTGGRQEWTYATEQYLTFARRLAEQGRRRECADICRRLVRQRTAPGETHVVSDALRILGDCLGDRAMGAILRVMDSSYKDLREAAVQSTRRFPGRLVTIKLVAKLKRAQPETRLAILRELGRRGDQSALPLVLRLVHDADPTTRLVALEAAHQLAPRKSIPAVLANLASADAEEIAAIRNLLVRTQGDDMLKAVVGSLSTVPPDARVMLLDVVGARGDKSVAARLFPYTGDPDPAVRLAAFKALGGVADAGAVPRLAQATFHATDAKERNEGLKALVRVCQRIHPVDRRAKPLLTLLPQTKGDDRALILAALSSIGGADALEAVVADTKHPEATVREAAVDALSNWPDMNAAPALLDIARHGTGEKQKVAALQGYLDLVAMPAKRPAAETIRLYEAALAAAIRPNEKRQALSGLGNVHDAAALKVVARYFDDKALSATAVAAAAGIVLPQNNKQKPLVGEDLTPLIIRAAAVTPNKRLKKQLTDYLNSLPKPPSANVARGKPVITSVPAQGDHTPRKAVDGNWVDPNAAWFGARWPSWLTVDLLKPTRIDSADVFFYWDGRRYYQYTLQVSIDNKHWQTVADKSKNTTPATSRGVRVTFPPVTARYVRINILKNSANEAVHLVELKVYRAGRAPQPSKSPKPDSEGFIPLFNGKDLTGWTGSLHGYAVQDGTLICLKKGGGLLHTEEQYADFHLKFEFKLEPNGNNGVGIRFTGGNPAYSGMEIQILDNYGSHYKHLQPYQYHGSIYGVVPAKRGYEKPPGQWNSEEIIAKGRHVTVILNGVTIVDADLDEASKNGTMDHKSHPGLKNKQGYIGFLGHGARVEFRNIRVKRL